MSTEHTPGPWSYWPNTAYPQGVITRDSTAGHIAVPSVMSDKQTLIANARLIAAAPDLLAALIELRDAPWLNLPGRAGDIAEAAINKATKP